MPKDSDSDSEDNSCQPLQNDSDADDSLVKEGSSATAKNGSRSNSPVAGLKLKKGKYKSNVIESSDSDTEVDEGNNSVTNNSVLEGSDKNQTPVENSNSEAHSSVRIGENQEIPTEIVVSADSGTVVVISDSDEELYACCASVESSKPDVVTSDNEIESSSGCESESDVTDSRSDVTDSGSETEEELQKNDRAHRQRQQKLKKFDDFKEQRRRKKLPT